MFKTGCATTVRSRPLPALRLPFVPALALTFLALVAPAALRAAPQLRYDTEYPSIEYSTRERTDRVAVLRAGIEAGAARVDFNVNGGYLTSLLEALDIPVSSQMLVFSATSFQGSLVFPERPRAIYFNDDTYVAFVQDSDVLELSAIDPVLGGVFYTLSQNGRGPPVIVDESDLCLRCHDSFGLSGGGVPRHLVGSMLSDENGMAISHEGWSLTDDRTPLRRRWGGWYVTGTHGAQTHRGNVIVTGPAEASRIDFAASGNRTDLRDLVDLGPYPTGHSDVVALMVLEHQIHVQNLITRMNYDVRTALAAERTRSTNPSDDAAPAGDVGRVVADVGEPLVMAMLLVDEATLGGSIAGTSGFAEDWVARVPRDRRGRSLRDLDLRRRLFQYPLSYLIYSQSFASMPDVARQYVYRRLRIVLSGEEDGDRFSHLSNSDRAAILEILLDTAPEFAAARD